MDREAKPNTSPSPAMDETLRSFYRRYQDNHQPTAEAFQRMFDTIPVATEASTGNQRGMGWIERLRQRWLWSVTPVLAGVCALLVWWSTGSRGVIGPNSLNPKQSTTPRVFVPKGQGVRFTLLHARRTPQGYLYQQNTRPGERLQPGDGVQLSYHVPQKMDVMLISVNQQGEVSVFVPLGQQRSLTVEAGPGTLPRQSALTLDDYVGYERFFFLYSSRPFSLHDVQRAAKQALVQSGNSLQKMDTLPGTWQCQTLLIEKVSGL